MKQYWNVTSSDPNLTPTVSVNQTVNATTKQVKTWVNITGLMSNQNLTTSEMVGSSAW